MRYALVALLAIGGCAPDASKPRKALESKSVFERREGAAALQKIYAKDPRSLGDHGENHWLAELARLPGASVAETQSILAGGRSLGSDGGGGGFTENYQLDDFWLVTLFGETAGHRITSYEGPRRKVRNVHVDRPAGFTGTWTTYYVNGAVFSAFEYEGGVPRRNREYHDDGKLRSEYIFVDGLLEGTVVTRFPNGATEWEEMYRKGKLDGVKKRFYANGKLREESEWADDKLWGRTTSYGKNGSRTSCIDYREGVELRRGCDDPLVEAKRRTSELGARYGLLVGAPECGPFSKRAADAGIDGVAVNDAGAGEKLFCHDGLRICDRGPFTGPKPTFEESVAAQRGRACDFGELGTCGSLRYLKIVHDEQSFSVRYFDAKSQMVAEISNDDHNSFCDQRAMISVQGSANDCGEPRATEVICGKASRTLAPPIIRAP